MDDVMVAMERSFRGRLGEGMMYGDGRPVWSDMLLVRALVDLTAEMGRLREAIFRLEAK